MEFSAYHLTVLKTETASEFICGHVPRKWSLGSDTRTLRSSLYKLLVCAAGRYAIIKSKPNQRHNGKKYDYNLDLLLESRPHPCNLPLQTQMKMKANLLYFR